MGRRSSSFALKNSLRSELRWQKVARPGVVLDQVLASVGMSGFAFSYAVTNNDLTLS
jgi:hypothetical protein